MESDKPVGELRWSVDLLCHLSAFWEWRVFMPNSQDEVHIAGSEIERSDAYHAARRWAMRFGLRPENEVTDGK